MAKNGRIALILEGVPEAEGRIRLNTFLTELQSLSAALGKICRDVSDGKPNMVFNVVELSYNSPMRVVVAPAPGQEQLASLVLQRFENVADAVSSGKKLEGYDAELLEHFRALAKPVGKQLKYATLLIDDIQYEMDDAVANHVDSALKVDEECIGSIEGRLEKINIHGNANTFHIYPDVGPNKVACHFPNSLKDEAILALGRKVEVSGVLKYRQGATFAHAISVNAIESFPANDESPTWEDLWGRAPDATGTLSSEAFVRELRDAWD
jgi:hypothetical protein